jgi:hypothetical protein
MTASNNGMPPNQILPLKPFEEGSNGVQAQGPAGLCEGGILVNEPRIIDGAGLREIAEHVQFLAQEMARGLSSQGKLDGLCIEFQVHYLVKGLPHSWSRWQREKSVNLAVLNDDVLGGQKSKQTVMKMPGFTVQGIIFFSEGTEICRIDHYVQLSSGVRR